MARTLPVAILRGHLLSFPIFTTPSFVGSGAEQVTRLALVDLKSQGVPPDIGDTYGTKFPFHMRAYAGAILNYESFSCPYISILPYT